MTAVIETAIIAYADLLDYCGRMLFWPFRRPLRRIHRRFDQLLLDRPGFWGDLWRLFHRADWQRSAKFNARMWVTGFMLFYPLARQLGYPLVVNLLITSSLDLLVYLYHKFRLWPEREVGVKKSYAVWYCFTVATFFVNLGAAWFLFDSAEIGKIPSKGVLAAFGILINPWVFRFRDEVAIRDRHQEAELA